jgi:hypothetical protein
MILGAAMQCMTGQQAFSIFARGCICIDAASAGTLFILPKHLESEQRKSYSSDAPSAADFGSLHSRVTKLIHAAEQNTGSRVCERLYGMGLCFRPRDNEREWPPPSK